MNRLDRIQMAINKGITCNPETGEVFGVRGKKIGKLDKDGYMTFQIKSNNKGYHIKAHQFIWFYVNKTIVDEIDHINQIKNDNRITNLRVSNRSLNNHNKINKGFHFCNRLKSFVSKIMIDGKTIYLGSYKTQEQAREAYLKAKKQYFPNL